MSVSSIAGWWALRSMRRLLAASTPALCCASTLSLIRVKASRTARASNGRLSGDFSMSWQIKVSSQMGMSRQMRDGRSNGPAVCSRNISMALSAMNGFLPVMSS